jgi:DNA-binding NtrC family response regulator
MAMVLLIGEDGALLEGLAQMLAGAGHNARVALTLTEALEVAAARAPMISVVDRRLALDEPEIFRIPMARGGAFLLYRSNAVAQDPLPPNVQRLVLAELTLPLERHRLFALIRHVTDRARVTGRKDPTPPEHRAL